jgi:acyl-CoA synthetase (AMP-forming)/AMP-acid ligase II
MNGTFIDYLQEAGGERPALADDRKQLTYDQLRRAAGQIATVVRARHGSGTYIVLRAQSQVDFVVTLLGIIYGGNTPVPVDPSLSRSALDYIREKSRAVAVLDPLAPAEYEREEPSRSDDASIPALILFTSGTTGYPKGVIVSHRNLIHSASAISEYLSYRDHRSAAVVLPLFYSYALLSQVFCQLFVGGFVRLYGDFKNPIKFSRSVEEAKLETFCGVPSTYNALILVHRMSRLSMPSVRIICSAGAAMDASKFQEIKEIFPNALFFNNYGMTEAAPRISYIREDDPRFLEPTCGRPMAGVEVKVVDPRSHEELPDGQPGMLVVRGPNVTSGYVNDEDLTQQAFTRDGFLISGDLAYMDKGYIFICGRADDIFNVGGEKVAPLEVERVLNGIAAVESSAVTGIPDPQRGMVPVAFLKLRAPITRRQLLEEINGELPGSKIPQRLFEVRGFPMTANGKLQRRKLSIEDHAHVIREIL